MDVAMPIVNAHSYAMPIPKSLSVMAPNPSGAKKIYVTVTAVMKSAGIRVITYNFCSLAR